MLARCIVGSSKWRAKTIDDERWRNKCDNGGETNVIDVSACFVFDLFELKMDVKV